jgi:hypothetical protein
MNTLWVVAGNAKGALSRDSISDAIGKGLHRRWNEREVEMKTKTMSDGESTRWKAIRSKCGCEATASRRSTGLGKSTRATASVKCRKGGTHREA